MTDTTITKWHECNQRYLMAALAVVREDLEHYAAAQGADSPRTGVRPPGSREARARLEQAAALLPAPSALETVVQLCGPDPTAKRAIAAHVCARLGRSLWRMRLRALPGNLNDLDVLARLWEQEVFLDGCTLFVDCDDLEAADTASVVACTALCERLRTTVLVSSRERIVRAARPTIVFDVEMPDSHERHLAWESALGSQAEEMDGQLGMIVSQFHLGTGVIYQVCSEVLGDGLSDSVSCRRDSDELSRRLWQACRVHTRTRLDGLAHRVRPVAGWDDLILPASQLRVLHEIAAQVRQRGRVYEDWGFGEESSRGLGISALFVGDSGTGKTMAAEVLANKLALDLYRIDLSRVVSKYIGETEANLRRIFEAAEKGGAILLFDEADALFGKRSEVRDSHDRYANIEVSYLLQGMENYRGLAILTTNLKSSLDKAFFRRIRFVVQFPFPDHQQRARIWEKIFPAQTPRKDLDIEKLARLNLTGGSIRNIALNAAFLAAEANTPVGMEHLWEATRYEYVKLEKPLSSAEIGRWE